MKQTKIKINKETIKKIVRLASLTLVKKESDELTDQLKEIVAFVEKLNEVDTTSVEPTSQVTGLENVWRQDKIEPGLKSAEVLQNTKAKQSGRFKVKAILNKREKDNGLK